MSFTKPPQGFLVRFKGLSLSLLSILSLIVEGTVTTERKTQKKNLYYSI